MIVDLTIGASVQQAEISFAASGDNIIVGGLTSKSIKVLQFFLVMAGATNLTLKSGTTALSGALTFLTDGTFVLDYIQLPITCNAADNFVINSSQAVQVSGMVWYVVS